jgi:McbB family protein
MQIMYFFRNFRMFILENTAICYSNGGAFQINEQTLSHILQKIEKSEQRTFSIEDLEKFLNEFSISLERFVKFATDEVKILIISKSNQGFDTIRIFSDSTESEYLQSELSKNGNRKVVLNNDKSISNEFPLIVVYQVNYDPDLIRSVYEKYKQNNSGFITSYVLLDRFIIDGIFIPSVGSPCHFCGIESWENIAIQRSNSPKASWLSFLQHSKKYKHIYPSKKLTKLEEFNCLYHLRNKVLSYCGIENYGNGVQEVFLTNEIHITTGRVETDIIPHGMDCDCLKEY